MRAPDADTVSGEYYYHYFSWIVVASVLGLAIFFVLVLAIAGANAKPLFFSLHGWSHRVAGAALLLWLVYGTVKVIALLVLSGKDEQTKSVSSTTTAATAAAAAPSSQQQWLLYDTILGLLGITATLTAARDFPHKYVQNAKGQSGSLSHKALVTQAEMIEHSFYQALNLLQAWYLHFVSTVTATATVSATASATVSTNANNNAKWKIALALWCVTSPWYLRQQFPVHSFSNNWNITPEHQRTTQEVLLYRIKKGQYLFYKHVLLHGLNISVALQQLMIIHDNNNDNNNSSTTSTIFTISPAWRIYWLALNTSYVMEFFLQTMVRRRVLTVSQMFALQRLLMVTSSIAATMILFQKQLVHSSVCLVSLILNLVHRKHDVSNVLITAGIFYYIYAHWVEKKVAQSSHVYT